MAEGSKGTVIRGADGTVYFLRDEVLEQCKVTEPEMAAFCGELLDKNTEEVSGFAMAAWNNRVNALITFEGPFASSTYRFDPGRAASSTVMCPGTMHERNFAVDPAARFSMGA